MCVSVCVCVCGGGGGRGYFLSNRRDGMLRVKGLELYKRVGISPVEVYKRVRNLVIRCLKGSVMADPL